MAEGTFEGFESYRLSGVQLTSEEFGRGSYAVVLRLEYRGLKCAGKQLYPALYEQVVGETVHRFEAECRMLAQIRHPNIVQFIGVYFKEGSRVPILVMEFLPTTLTKCIGILSEKVSYSILHDVALGLYHLHSQTPPIVHRDLSANNVLLASNMTAKISDLGVAKILNLTPQQMSRMTRTPGTPAYMPPEAMGENPSYDTSIDEFSYGILMIHVLSGKWPLPLREPNPENQDELLPVTEAERRDTYLRDIGNAHPLMDLIRRCVHNDPVRRVRATEIVQRMDDMVRQFPPSFADRVKMLQRIETETKEKETFKIENQILAAEVEQLVQNHQEEIKRFQQVHSINEKCIQRQEVLQTMLRTQAETHQTEMRAQNETHQAKMIAQNETHQAEVRAYQAEMRAQNATHQTEMKAQNEIHQTKMKAQNEIHQTKIKAQNETHQTEMKAQNETHQTEMKAQNEVIKQERRSLTTERDSLQSEVSRLRGVNQSLQSEVTSKKEIIQSKDKEISLKKIALTSKDATLTQKESELASKKVILECQVSTIRELNEQLTRAREVLSRQKPQSHPTHTQVKITWKPCSDLPVGMFSAQAVVIGDKVYCGGGTTTTSSSPIAQAVFQLYTSFDAAAAAAAAAVAADDAAAQYRVFCYSPSEDTWKALPACCVRYFGLGSMRGKLVTVGGRKKSDDIVTNRMYEFDEVTRRWKQSNPPMPTARHSPAVLSHHSALIVAGGNIGAFRSTLTTVVELFREETSQWHTTEPLPFRWIHSSSSLNDINNRWYLLGGRVKESEEIDSNQTNQAVCAHVNLLLQKPLPREQASTDKESTPAWEVLPNTLPYKETAIQVYSPLIHAWIHINDLPAPRTEATAVMLSPKELLIIGGCNRGKQKSVYKGRLWIE